MKANRRTIMLAK